MSKMTLAETREWYHANKDAIHKKNDFTGLKNEAQIVIFLWKFQANKDYEPHCKIGNHHPGDYRTVIHSHRLHSLSHEIRSKSQKDLSSLL